MQMQNREEQVFAAVGARDALASQFGKWQADANSGTLKRRIGDWYGRNRASGRTRRAFTSFLGLTLWKGGRSRTQFSV